MNKPIRITLSRRAGWRIPDNTVVVSRPSKWGNPIKPGVEFTLENEIGEDIATINAKSKRECAFYYERFAKEIIEIEGLDISELKGKNLACWCPEGEPCHADTLLRLANDEEAK